FWFGARTCPTGWVPRFCLFFLVVFFFRLPGGWGVPPTPPRSGGYPPPLDKAQASGRSSGDVWRLCGGLPASAKGFWVGLGCVLHSTILFPVESLRTLLGLVRCRSMARKR